MGLLSVLLKVEEGEKKNTLAPSGFKKEKFTAICFCCSTGPLISSIVVFLAHRVTINDVTFLRSARSLLIFILLRSLPLQRKVEASAIVAFIYRDL